MPVTEASVIIAISSPHRGAALEGAQFAIDQLKASVPIWKKVSHPALVVILEGLSMVRQTNSVVPLSGPTDQLFSATDQLP